MIVYFLPVIYSCEKNNIYKRKAPSIAIFLYSLFFVFMIILLISLHFGKNTDQITDVFKICCTGSDSIRNTTSACNNFKLSTYGYCSNSEYSLYSLKGLYFREIIEISFYFLVYIICLYFYNKVTYFMLYREGKIIDQLNDNNNDSEDSDYSVNDEDKSTCLDYIGERRISLRQAYNRKKYISYSLYVFLIYIVYLVYFIPSNCHYLIFIISKEYIWI